jgi:DNA polymerase III sliding clamp (beta) subunit (PCNA family)
MKTVVRPVVSLGSGWPFLLTRLEKIRMKIELPVVELKKALPGLGKVVDTRSPLPVLGCVKVYSTPDAGTYIEASNIDDYAAYQFAGSSGSGEVIISYESLSKIVKGCGNEGTIEILVGERDTRVRYPIGSSAGEQTVASVPLSDWPPIPKLNVPMAVLDEKFQQALRPALECASEDDSRILLNSVYLDTSEKKSHYVVSTDGRHLFSANSFTFDLPHPVILPTKKFLSWKGFQEDGVWSLGTKTPPLEKNGEDSWVQVQSKNWTFITKQPFGNYPNWRQVIPSGTGTVLQFGPEAVGMLLKAIPQIPGKSLQNEPVQLVIQKEQLLLQGRNNESDTWTTVPVVDVKITGNPVTIALNRTYLAKAFKFGLTELTIIDADTPVVFRAEGKRMVVMVLRNTAKTEPVQAPQTTSPEKPSTQVEPPKNEKPEERTEMPTEVNRIEKQMQTASEKPEASAFEKLEEQVETIKTTLKGVVTQLNDVLKTVSQAYKEKRATDKEMESIRESLQEIQRIKF